jgi:diguanylate cyclase (GGDEF)-like protein
MRPAQSQLTDQTRTVLLVDETGQHITKVQPILEPNPQYRLLTCRAHADALTLLHDQEVDVLIFGCNCTPLPCPSVISDLYNGYPAIPIIALSDSLDKHQGQVLIDAHATDYLSADTLNEEILLRSLRYAEKSSRQDDEIRCLRGSDMLTMVSNRQSFYLQLQQKLDKLPASGRQLVLVTVDLDEFRKFNSHFGFSTGDRIVLEMGSRLQNTIQPNELIARFGSDEFAMLLDLDPVTEVQDTIKSYLNRLIASLKAPYSHGSNNTQIHCSIGVALAPVHGCEVDLLAHQATQARLSAKQVHGCSYAFFRPGMDEGLDRLPNLGADMAKALPLNQFELYYQPRINLDSGQITGAEALIRWNHPAHGLVMPGDFIPISERNGMIGSIGYWVLYQAGKHLKELREAGLSLERLGINLSFHQFKDEKLVDIIKRIVAQEEIDTSVLEFELTESAIFSDEEHVINCLDSLAEEGITFSLDDFGTGYSSFALLHKLPISALKIDRSFVSHVNESSEAAEIVRSIISLTQNMKIKVIAEGVETRQQLDFLIQHDCDDVQGFYFSPPVPFAAFKRMLSNPGKIAGNGN